MRFFLLLWALLPLSLEWQFKTFSTQLTSAICFLLVPGRCLTSQKIKIETMKANDFNFLLSYLQVYLNLPLFLSLPCWHKGESIPSPSYLSSGLTLQGHYCLKTTARSHPADLFPGSQQRLPLQHSTLLVSLLHPDCSQREHATHNWGHVTVLSKTFFHGLNYV